jgi:hypothetical protein
MRGAARVFLRRGALGIVMISEFVSHAIFHATLKGMDIIGVSSYSVWIRVRCAGVMPVLMCWQSCLEVIWVESQRVTW